MIPTLETAIENLGEQFARRNWSYLDVPAGSPMEKSYAWPGPPEENIMICVHKGPDIHEMFHRQDFFFFNFAYSGDYGALSYQYDNHITIRENECYIGQPFAGYALYAHSKQEIIIIGILIQKEAFFKTFLPVLSADTKLFHFFLDPQTYKYSEEFIHLHFDDSCSIRTLLEMMVMEYANPQEDTQAILQPMVLTLLMMVARQYKRSIPVSTNERLSDKIVRYMGFEGYSEAFFVPSQLYFYASAQRNREVLFRNSFGTADGPGGQSAERHESFHRRNRRHTGLQ